MNEIEMLEKRLEELKKEKEIEEEIKREEEREKEMEEQRKEILKEHKFILADINWEIWLYTETVSFTLDWKYKPNSLGIKRIQVWNLKTKKYNDLVKGDFYCTFNNIDEQPIFILWKNRLYLSDNLSLRYDELIKKSDYYNTNILYINIKDISI